MFMPPQVMVNHANISLTELAKYTCYMDKSYPLFSGKSSVEKMVLKGLQEHSLPYGTEDIRNLFCLDQERFSRPLTGVGNEIFNAMAAIGYCHGKQVFCFPWLSNKRFQYYKGRMPKLMETLQNLNLIVVFPKSDSIRDI